MYSAVLTLSSGLANNGPYMRVFAAFGALTLLVGQQEGHLVCKKTEWWGAGVVICPEPDADLHIIQLMPLPLTVSCFSEIHIGFTFLVPAQPGSPGKMAVKRARVCVCVFYRNASLYSGCVTTIQCAGVKDNDLYLDVLTAVRHAELHQNVCANAVREGPSLLT